MFDSARIQQADQFSVSCINLVQVSKLTSIKLYCLSCQLRNQNQVTVSRRGSHWENLPCDWFATLHRVQKLLNSVTIAQYYSRWLCQLVAVIAASNLRVLSRHIRHNSAIFIVQFWLNQSCYLMRNIIWNFSPFGKNW